MRSLKGLPRKLPKKLPRSMRAIVVMHSGRVAAAASLSLALLASPGASAEPKFVPVAHPTFRKAWKAPDGTIWSGYLGQATNTYWSRDAEMACRAVRGFLPSGKQYAKLISYFGGRLDVRDDTAYYESSYKMSYEGLVEFHKTLPHMEKWLWTSTLHSENPTYRKRANVVFDGRMGLLTSDDVRSEAGVVCVDRQAP